MDCQSAIALTEIAGCFSENFAIATSVEVIEHFFVEYGILGTVS